MSPPDAPPRTLTSNSPAPFSPNTVVDVIFVTIIDGGVEDFRTDPYRASLSSLLSVQGLTPLSIAISVSPASVRVESIITVASERATATVTVLNSRSAASLTAALGVRVERIEIVHTTEPRARDTVGETVITDDDKPLGQATGADKANNSALSDGDESKVAIIVTCVSLVLVALAIGIVRRCRHRLVWLKPKGMVGKAVYVHATAAAEVEAGHPEGRDELITMTAASSPCLVSSPESVSNTGQLETPYSLTTNSPHATPRLSVDSPHTAQQSPPDRLQARQLTWVEERCEDDADTREGAKRELRFNQDPTSSDAEDRCSTPLPDAETRVSARMRV